MALPKKTGETLRRVLTEFDPESRWCECLESVEIVRGTVEEYENLATKLKGVYSDEDECARLCLKMREVKALPRRFVRHFGNGDEISEVDGPIKRSRRNMDNEIAEITARLVNLESMLSPLTKERVEREALLAESGKLLKATNMRLDELPKAAPVVAPKVEPLATVLPLVNGRASVAQLLRR